MLFLVIPFLLLATVQLKGNLIYVGISHTCFSPVACARIHARQSITVTGNDAGYSPPSLVLDAGLYG